MAILRKSSKLEGQDPHIFVIKSAMRQEIPPPSVGVFDISHEGTPAYDPEIVGVEPMSNTPPEKIDHRPKDWYDKQCSYENYITGLKLNSQPLNTEVKPDSGEKK